VGILLQPLPLLAAPSPPDSCCLEEALPARQHTLTTQGLNLKQTGQQGQHGCACLESWTQMLCRCPC